MKHNWPLLSLSLVLAACSNKNQTVEKDPLAQSSAPLSQSAAPSASVASMEAPKKPTLPLLQPEPVAALSGWELHPIEGALMAINGLDVGRIVDDKIDKVGTIPDTNQWLGGSHINGVYGRWPDDVDVLYSSNNGRASQPTLFPLTGKGAAVMFGAGGGLGWYAGLARLGKTTIAGGYDMGESYHFGTVRGPGLVIKPIRAEKVGCTEEELSRQWANPDAAVAVAFRALASTEKGTLITVGNLCDREKEPVAEVWDQPGKSRIIDLKSMVKSIDYFPKLLPGKGDELWLNSSPILRYRDGKFEPLPKLDKYAHNLFVSPEGKLHAIAGRTIYRFDEDKWTPLALLPSNMSFWSIAMDEKGVIWVAYRGISRLKEVPGGATEDECKTPFVYLYDVSWKNDAKYTYPTTRKALASFPAVSEISLVEYWEDKRSLGVIVKSREQGEQVVKHIQATMKDEAPELICYAPTRKRVIDMEPSAKP